MNRGSMVGRSGAGAARGDAGAAYMARSSFRKQIMSSTGIAVGLNKGFPVTKKQVAPRPASRKGRAGKKIKLVRSVVREVVGLMPYEKRILDMIKSGGSSAEKRIYKFSKKRLGTHRRALQKREEMKAYYAALRAKQAGV
ncbi:hypothetical protein PybrP1_004449 [[Pythium] brassicae (nom. inval.)]|nr:hypothetical protein PybrP1_004449 [[Pythium] brassicae (nom. inval.)]